MQSSSLSSPPRVMVAGATGYIGGGVAHACHREGLFVRALARDPARVQAPCDEVFQAHATRPHTLFGLCDGIDVVFSSIGIHTFDANPSLWEVDYQANLNLLEEAKRAGVKHFIFLSVLRCEEMASYSDIARARWEVSRAIARSGLGYTILEPTGFFNDMYELYKSAERLGVSLTFGSPDGECNPLSAIDLGEWIAEQIRGGNLPNRVVDCGGPERLRHEEICARAFEALGKRPRLVGVPPWVMRAIAEALRPFNDNAHALFRFFEFCSQTPDMCGRPIGRRRVGRFFANVRRGMSLYEADLHSAQEPVDEPVRTSAEDAA